MFDSLNFRTTMMILPQNFVGFGTPSTLPVRGDKVPNQIKTENTRVLLNGQYTDKIGMMSMQAFSPLETIVGKSKIDVNGDQMLIDSIFRFHPDNGDDSFLVVNLTGGTPKKVAV